VACDTEKDTLSLTLYEKHLVGKQLAHTPQSCRALVQFSGVVVYLVADETNLPWNAYDERDDGYLHLYTKSEFLDFMNRVRGQTVFDSFPKSSSHYGLATSDHIVHVMATEEPRAEIVR
jgi:hypothetical protein